MYLPFLSKEAGEGTFDSLLTGVRSHLHMFFNCTSHSHHCKDYT